jgi:conserved oligomeric Golgi complex subunit 3
MTRALTLVRVYVVNSLKSISNDINQRISGKAMNETTQSALLYAKFRSSAPPLKKVVGEIEQRSHDNDEYAALLNECYQAYFGIRLRLITPIIMSRMAEISGTKDIVPYVSLFIDAYSSADPHLAFYGTYVRMSMICSSNSS